MSNSDKKRQKRLSKFLSLILRHQPDTVRIQLDDAGWAVVDDLLAGCTCHGHPISEDDLRRIVADNDKQRFEFDSTGKKIRARQGHSIPVELGYEAQVPPPELYHGTPEKFIPPIRNEGLKSMQRHHVHLHEDYALAKTVGGRRGKPVVLRIKSSEMTEHGHQFYKTENSVWLTEHVPPEFIDFDFVNETHSG